MAASPVDFSLLGFDPTQFDPSAPIDASQTAAVNTSLPSQPDNTDSAISGASLAQTIGALSTLGVSIGSIVTGRPVLTTNVNGQRVASLGQAPIVTGQVQANFLVFAVIGVAIAAMFIFARKP